MLFLILYSQIITRSKIQLLLVFAARKLGDNLDGIFFADNIGNALWLNCSDKRGRI